MTEFGRNLHAYDVVGSTQDVARELAEAGAEAGTVVTARAMTAGRGRRGRTWHVPPGKNVCMTAIGPAVLAGGAWQIALLGGVAVAESVQDSAGVRSAVRFPNDVYLNGRKLAGILVETIPAAQKGCLTPLIGIGMNVNVTEDEFPEALRPTATSLLRETGRDYDVEQTTRAVLTRLSALWELWQVGGLSDALLPRWREWADPEARRTFVLDGTPAACRVRDITGAGRVLLEAEDGRTHDLHAAQVILGDD